MTGFKSCCGFPHGSNSMYAMILAVASYLLAISSTWGCYFASVDFIFINDVSTQYTNVLGADGMHVGLFTFEDKTSPSDMTCRIYSNVQLDSFDTAFHTARAFGILASILIGAAMICLMCLSCIAVRKPITKTISVLLFLGGLCQGLTLIVFASDALCQTCYMFFGAGVTILCSITTLINAIITYRIKEVENDREVLFESSEEEMMKGGGDEEQEVHATSSSGEESITDKNSLLELLDPQPVVRVHETDTNREVIKTIVNQDGSRTVEETTVIVHNGHGRNNKRSNSSHNKHSSD